MSDDFVTPLDIHQARPDIPLHTIRRHVRAGAPWFPGARKAGVSWVVPVAEAEHFCEHYQRYQRGPK